MKKKKLFFIIYFVLSVLLIGTVAWAINPVPMITNSPYSSPYTGGTGGGS